MCVRRHALRTGIEMMLQHPAEHAAVGAAGSLLHLAMVLAMSAAVTRARAEASVVFDLDAASGPSVTSSEGTGLYVAAAQADGKVLLGGCFNLLGDVPANGVARIDSAGNIDPNFQAWPGTRGTVRTAIWQPDGKTVVGGQFTEIGGEFRSGLARLEPDGKLDPGFQPRLGGGENIEVLVVRLQADGCLLVGGRFRTVDDQPRSCVVRLTQQGSLDPAFDPGDGPEDNFAAVHDLAIQQDGKVLVAGVFTKFNGAGREGLARLMPDGSLDLEFDPKIRWSPGLAYVHAICVDRANNILIGGRFDNVDGQSRIGLARLREQGLLDATFDAGNGIEGQNEPLVHILRELGGGRILVGGSFERVGGVPRSGIALLSGEGIVDEKFDPGTGFVQRDGTAGIVHDIACLPDGSLVAVGTFESVDGTPSHGLAKLTADGAVVRASALTKLIPQKVGVINALTPQPGGTVVVGGKFEKINGIERHALARLDPTGQPDTEFISSLEPDSIVNTVLCIEKGQLLIGGEFKSVAELPRVRIARLDADGTLDTEFDAGSGPNGPVYALATQPDGAALVGGAFSVFNGHLRLGLARVDWSGAVDPDFAPEITFRNGAGETYALLVQPDGQVLVGGLFDTVNGRRFSSLARLLPNGELDHSFGRDLHFAGPTAQVLCMALQANGKILVAGAFEQVNGLPRKGLARLNIDGSIDPGLDPGSGVDGQELPVVYAVEQYPNAGLLIAGCFTSFDGLHRGNFAQIATNGRLINPLPCTALAEGTDGVVNAVARQSDGSVLLGGGFTRVGLSPRQGLVRLVPVPVDLLRLRIEVQGGAPVLSWTGDCRLQQAFSLTENWEDVPGAKPPHRVLKSDSPLFFRLVR